MATFRNDMAVFNCNMHKTMIRNVSDIGLFVCFYSDMKKGSASCNTCTHPTCNHSQNSLGVSNCVECDTGILVLDPSSMPKWKLGCNRCDVIVMLFENAQKVSVLNEEACGECEAQLMKVEYKEDPSLITT